jgi:hypothetical protein
MCKNNVKTSTFGMQPLDIWQLDICRKLQQLPLELNIDLINLINLN